MVQFLTIINIQKGTNEGLDTHVKYREEDEEGVKNKCTDVRKSRKRERHDDGISAKLLKQTPCPVVSVNTVTLPVRLNRSFHFYAKLHFGKISQLFFLQVIQLILNLKIKGFFKSEEEIPLTTSASVKKNADTRCNLLSLISLLSYWNKRKRRIFNQQVRIRFIIHAGSVDGNKSWDAQTVLHEYCKNVRWSWLERATRPSLLNTLYVTAKM